MIVSQVASGIARTFDSDLDENEQMVRGAMWLGNLDDLSGLEARYRARVCAAVIRIAVADPEDPEITLAWNWREQLNRLIDNHRRIELLYKGWYAARAAVRIATSDDVVQAINRERLYHRQQVQAAQHRSGIWQSMDSLSKIYGTILGWYSVLGPTTTPECREAHGNNFHVEVPPAIGYPGMVHGECKCTPGRPHANGGMLN